jgi:uncharacterized protein involved in exopolysaccharide biosynthesis
MTEPSDLPDDQLIGDDDEVRLIDLLLVIAENLRLLVFGPLVVGLAALGIAFTITPMFTGTTTILTPQPPQSMMALLAQQLGGLAAIAGLGGSSSPLVNPAEIYMTLIQSRSVADRIVDRFNLMQLYGVELRVRARTLLGGVTKVTADKSGLITIEIKDKDPKRAAEMANAYVEELARLTGGLAITEAQKRRAFFEKQLQTVQKNLLKAQLALGEVGVPESLIKSSPVAVLETIAQLRAQVTAQEVRVSTMRGVLTEQNPEFQLAQRQLASLRAQLVQSDRPQPVGDTQRDEYLNRFRDFKYQETLFELLAKQLESARLDEAREGSIVQVIDAALPPEFRSSPKRAQIAVLATLATGVILLLLVFVREALRSARNAPESASKLARIKSGLRRSVWRARK